jgi:hypothetical protein
MYNKVKRETGLISEYFENLGKGGVKWNIPKLNGFIRLVKF